MYLTKFLHFLERFGWNDDLLHRFSNYLGAALYMDGHRNALLGERQNYRCNPQDVCSFSTALSVLDGSACTACRRSRFRAIYLVGVSSYESPGFRNSVPFQKLRPGAVSEHWFGMGFYGCHLCGDRLYICRNSSIDRTY